MFALKKKLGIAEVGDLNESLSLLLENDDELVVDANAVESLDIAALQVLVAFSSAAIGLSKTVHWISDTGVLRESVALAGLDTLLSLDTPIPSSTDGGEKEEDGLCPVF